MDASWDDIRLFLAVAETGSVSAAARQLRVGQATVSRRLSDLEYRLGATLFRRSAQGVVPTSAGEQLTGPARKMAEWAGEVARVTGREGPAPAGLVRVTAAPGVAADLVVPLAARLGARHPGLRLEVLCSFLHLDLARGEADLSLRLRGPVQTDLKLLGTVRYESAAFATRAVAARLPRRPALAEVPWIAWAAPWEQLMPNPLLAARIPGFKPAFASDNFLVNLAAAEAGLGAIVLPRLRHRYSRATTLAALPLELGPRAEGSLQLVCARSAYDIPRVRLVADAFAEELSRATAS